MKKKFHLGLNFQADLLKMMTESTSFLLMCKKEVKPEFFSSDRLERYSKLTYKFFKKYGELPGKTYFESVSKTKKDKALVRKIFKDRTINREFIKDATQEFVRRSHFISSYQKSGELYNQGRQDEAYDYMMNGMEKLNNIDFNVDKYEFLLADFEKREIDRNFLLNTQSIYKVPLGIPILDNALRGGVGNGELFVYMGDAKSGKSFGLIHAGVNAVKRFIPTLHYQLEGPKMETLNRYDAAFMNATYESVANCDIKDSLKEKMKRIANRRKFKDLILRHYSDWAACSVLDIERDYLDLVSRGFPIKLIIVDYLDLMRARDTDTLYGENVERRNKTMVTRDLKTFATKYNLPIITATQANRANKEQAEDPDFYLTSKNVSEDYNVIRILDHLVTINVTSEERSKGRARLFLDTTRGHSSKQKIHIGQDLKKSRFYKNSKRRVKR